MSCDCNITCLLIIQKKSKKRKESKININTEKLNKRKEKLSVSKAFHNSTPSLIVPLPEELLLCPLQMILLICSSFSFHSKLSSNFLTYSSLLSFLSFFYLFQFLSNFFKYSSSNFLSSHHITTLLYIFLVTLFS